MQKPQFVALVLAVLLVVPCVWSQTGAGTVSGTVRDASQAVIPKAPVELTNTATHVTSATQTNEVGFFTFQGLIPGVYRLSVHSPGFQTYQGTVTLQTARSAVIDPVLQPGDVTTKVEVADVTPLLTVDSAITQQTMDYKRIQMLPVNGRTLRTLTLLTTGVELLYSGTQVYGTPREASEWNIDGTVVTDWRNAMALWSSSPGVSSIQEFTVSTGALSARHSRPANIIVSTKGGTNALHGMAYYTHWNSGFGVARRRQDYYKKPPHELRHEYGIAGGGPVVIPKVYKGTNRTFWYFNYEAYRQDMGGTSSLRVPTAAMRNGDFSQLKDSQGRLQVLYDPLTTSSQTFQRQPFAYGGKVNVVDPNRISPVAAHLHGVVPLPTNPDNPLVADNWCGPVSRPNARDGIIPRLDHRIGNSHNLTFKGNYIAKIQDNGTPYLDRIVAHQYILDGERDVSASWTYTISPAFLNELFASLRYRIGGGSSGPAAAPLEKDWFKELGLSNPFSGGLYGSTGWPQLRDTGFNDYTVPGFDRAYETYYTLEDNMTRILGKHSLQFGGRWRRDHLNTYPNDANQSSYSYASLATALYDPASSKSNPQVVPQTGHNAANFFLGHSTHQASMIRNWYYLRQTEVALYFQDDWRATRNLTLNLGLRWERWGAYREKNSLMSGFQPSTKSTVLGLGLQKMYDMAATVPSVVEAYRKLGWNYKTWDQAGLPQTLNKARPKNFGPRLGFAYQPFKGTGKAFVIRGGYSLSYFRGLPAWLDAFKQNTPITATFNYNLNDATQSPTANPNYWLQSAPQIINGRNSGKVLTVAEPRGITRGTAYAAYWADEIPDSRVHAWSLTLERELKHDMVASVAYNGNRTLNLISAYSYNDNPPDYIWYQTTREPLPSGEFANVLRRPLDQNVFGSIVEYRNAGYVHNNSLTFQIQRRFSRGYTFNVAYNLINSLMANGNVAATNQFLPGAVPGDYQERVRFLQLQRQTTIPKHRVRWDWLCELPFGNGKVVGRHASGVVGRLIGGWQLGGLGTWFSNYASLPANNWQLTGVPVEEYGYKYPVQDCTSGSCYPGYLWWNGYISQNRINSLDANGKPNGIMGVPAGYRPAVKPLIPWGSTSLPANAPVNTNVSTYWDTNNVWIPMKNGTVQRIAYSDNMHPWRNQYFKGVRLWSMDASLIKNIAIRERFSVRVSVDAFNVLNMPGNPNSIGSNGVLSTRNSGNSARHLQASLRVEW